MVYHNNFGIPDNRSARIHFDTQQMNMNKLIIKPINVINNSLRTYRVNWVWCISSCCFNRNVFISIEINT